MWDHRQMIRAVRQVIGEGVTFYRDTPYAIRNPAAEADVALAGLCGFSVGIARGLERKVLASCAYRSQVGFQFGGAAAAAAALQGFACSEGGRGASGAVLWRRAGCGHGMAIGQPYSEVYSLPVNQPGTQTLRQ